MAKLDNKNTTHTVLMIISGVIVIALAFFLTRKFNKTGQTDQKAEGYANFVVNDTRSVLYNTNGFYNFYSSGEIGSLFFNNREQFDGFVSYIMYFLPSYIDDYCKSFDKQQIDPVRCNNLFIDNVALPDNKFGAISQKELPCTSVITSTAPQGATNVIRIFNNTYSFLKRCLRFKTMTVSSRMMQLDSKPVQGYKISVTGDISAFVLSRPLFISFGTYGLYQIVHSAVGSVFSDYSSTSSKSAEQFFMVVPVKGYNGTAMYPSINQNLSQLPENTTIPITIYYLNYNAAILPSEFQKGMHTTTSIANSLTLVLSSSFLNNSVPNGSKSVSYTIPTTQDVTTNNILTPTNISIVFDKTSNNANEILTTTISYGTSFKNIAIKMPPQFLNEIAYLRKSNMNHTYHIVLTYSCDVFMVVCFINYQNTLKEDAVFVSRQTVSLGSDFVNLTYDVDKVNTAISTFNGNLQKEMAKYEQFLSISSIPNFAYMAKYLGYTI